MTPDRILVVDDDDSIRRVLAMQLEEAGYQVLAAAGIPDARRILDEQRPRLVITDLKMHGGSGLDLIRYLRHERRNVTAIVVTAFGAAEGAAEAIKEGAYEYVNKPIDYDVLVAAVGRAIERQRLLDEVGELRARLDHLRAPPASTAPL